MSVDPSGIGAIGESVRIAVETGATFLKAICLPMAEEWGLSLRDRVASYRARNATAILAKAADKAGEDPGVAAPRIVAGIMEHGSWADDPMLQDMWAGLMAASCDEIASDENIIFVSLMQNMTSVQCRILRFACETCRVQNSKGFPYVFSNTVSLSALQEAVGVADLFRLDREMDHLRVLGIFADGSGFNAAHGSGSDPDLSPTPLGLELFVKCTGSKKTVGEYFATTG